MILYSFFSNKLYIPEHLNLLQLNFTNKLRAFLKKEMQTLDTTTQQPKFDHTLAFESFFKIRPMKPLNSFASTSGQVLTTWLILYYIVVLKLKSMPLLTNISQNT